MSTLPWWSGHKAQGWKMRVCLGAFHLNKEQPEEICDVGRRGREGLGWSLPQLCVIAHSWAFSYFFFFLVWEVLSEAWGIELLSSQVPLLNLVWQILQEGYLGPWAALSFARVNPKISIFETRKWLSSWEHLLFFHRTRVRSREFTSAGSQLPLTLVPEHWHFWSPLAATHMYVLTHVHVHTDK